MPTKRYDEEFKRNCVDLLLKSGKQLKPMARELGVSDSTLRAWRDQYLGVMEEQYDRPPGGATPREMANEIRQLRRDIDRVTEQREILKKALSILSDESPRGMR